MIETPHEILAHDASDDAVRSFMAWRKSTKKPLTDRAACLIAKSIREITAKGGDADEALDLAQEHGWQTIKPHWYWRIKNEETRCIDTSSARSINGGKNAGRNFDDNHREYARLVGTGQIVREPDPSDPFA
jgi:predicted ThiF/HesA family dinucleotide-utilizing enzyme